MRDASIAPARVQLIVGPDSALYTSNWGISFAADGGDGQVLRIVP